MTETAAFALWWIAVIAALVVTFVVAVLVRLIVATARDIETAVAEIWTRGQRVANNTIHIPNLYRTVETVEAIGGRAGRILANARAIAEHAETCPGCPACILGKKP